MNSDNQQDINCPEDDEYRVYCEICDNSCTERFYESHLRSQTHINNIAKNPQLINSLDRNIPFNS